MDSSLEAEMKRVLVFWDMCVFASVCMYVYMYTCIRLKGPYYFTCRDMPKCVYHNARHTLSK